jgi:pimeloyl-ACP methyl ester carboxylesterase
VRTESQYLAALLARRGIAFLAYDKRGNGQSTGRYPGEAATTPTVDILSRDAAAAVAFLAAQPEIDRNRLGLAGASQAGWIIPPAAVRAGPLVHWALIESGPVVPTGESDLYASLVSHGDVPLPGPIDDILDQVRKAGPVGFDPVPALRKLRIPIVWLYGEVDRSQPTALDVPVLERLRDATGADLTWHVFTSADHFLFELPSALNADRPASRGVVREVAPAVDTWLRAHKLAA